MADSVENLKIEKLEFVMNGILLRLKIDPAAVQSPRGSNALQAVQTLFGLSLNVYHTPIKK